MLMKNLSLDWVQTARQTTTYHRRRHFSIQSVERELMHRHLVTMASLGCLVPRQKDERSVPLSIMLAYLEILNLSEIVNF